MEQTEKILNKRNVTTNKGKMYEDVCLVNEGNDKINLK